MRHRVGAGWGNVERKTEEDVVVITWTIGLPKLWSSAIRNYTQEKEVQIEEAQDRRTWRMKTRCADPK